MSQFFKSTGEESQVKKKVQQEESSSNEEAQQSKKETKSIQIQSELNSVLESPTNKNVEKAFKSIIKNQKFLKKNNSDFLKRFLKEIKNKKITKTMQKKADDIYAQFFNEINVVVEKVVKKRDLQDVLLEIVNLEDLNAKLNRLSLLDCNEPAELFKIKLTALQIHFQNNLLNEILTLLNELTLIYENNELLFFNNQDLKNIFIGQFRIYFDWLIKYNREDLILQIKDILHKYSPELVEKKVLEFYYFTKQEFPENDYFEFQIPFLVNTNRLIEAIDFFQTNQSNFDLENPINLKGLILLAESTFKKQFYEVSFCVYEKLYCFDKQLIDFEPLFVLCVLCDNLEKKDFFKSFLESFVGYENEMLLKSCDRKKEIFRAFFMRHNGAFEQMRQVLLELGYDVVVNESCVCVLATN